MALAFQGNSCVNPSHVKWELQTNQLGIQMEQKINGKAHWMMSQFENILFVDDRNITSEIAKRIIKKSWMSFLYIQNKI